MKHLKLFEAFGVDFSIESQVNEYFKEVQDNPDKLKFDFLFKNGTGNYFFKLIIISNHGAAGSFMDSIPSSEFIIILKDRNDKPTLLHEVKHLDYRTKNKKIYQKVYYKANQILNQYPDAPATLVEIFYLFDENEFQSKYHGYYSEFDNFIKNKVSDSTTIDDLKILFAEFLTKGTDDRSWIWYMYNKKIRFTDFISKKKLDICFYNMLEESVKDKINPYNWSKSWIVNSIKLAWYEFRKRMGSWTPEERKEIDKLTNYFEKEIQQRQSKFHRKFVRLIPLMAKKYNIKY